MRATTCLVAALALSCAPEIVERTVIEDLRILAMRSDPAEPFPGNDVNFSALIVDPLGAGRPRTVRWSYCTPDPIEGLESCDDPARRLVVSSNSFAQVTIADDFLDGFPPEARPEGADLFLVLEVTAPPDARAIAMKRVRVSIRSEGRNTNPQIEELLVAGQPDNPTIVTAGEDVELRVRPTAVSREIWDSPLGPVMEEMRFTWWTTGGELEDAVNFGGPVNGTAKTKWITAVPATLWVVLRDPRGGISWITRTVQAP